MKAYGDSTPHTSASGMVYISAYELIMMMLNRLLFALFIMYCVKAECLCFHPFAFQMLEFKFEFLQVICNHEHYIPLNLPLDVRGT